MDPTEDISDLAAEDIFQWFDFSQFEDLEPRASDLSLTQPDLATKAEETTVDLDFGHDGQIILPLQGISYMNGEKPAASGSSQPKELSFNTPELQVTVH